MSLRTAEETAAMLGKSKHRIYELARRGLLPSVRLGRSIAFDEDTLKKWIADGGKALPGGWRQTPRSIARYT
jgi:excisionase family DNA binding protein